MEKFLGYSFEPDRLETSALNKHLHLREQVISESDLLSIVLSDSQKPVILIVSHLEKYRNVIEQSLRPIVLVHLSDEAYAVKQANLYLHPSIVLILRNHHVFPLFFLLSKSLSWLSITGKWVIHYWRDQISFRENLHHANHIIFSRRYLLRQIRFAWLLRKVSAKVMSFPLNETNYYHEGTNDIFPPKDINVFFAGGIHSSERIVARRVAFKLGFAHGYTGEWNPGAGASLASKDYVHYLKRSYFGLSPNGHVNQECFRLYEIVSSGTLPIVAAKTPYQPFNYFKELYDLDCRLMVDVFNEKNVSKVIQNISDLEYPELLLKLKNAIANSNEVAHQALCDVFREK